VKTDIISQPTSYVREVTVTTVTALDGSAASRVHLAAALNRSLMSRTESMMPLLPGSVNPDPGFPGVEAVT